MPFSKTFVWLILAGIVPILAGALVGGAFYVFLAYNLVLLGLLVADHILTPGKKYLEASRVCDGKFSLGTENFIGIAIRNKSGYVLDVQCRDEVPAYIRVISRTVRMRAAPYSETEGKYCINPEKRGEFTFGTVHVRYSGIMKLCMKAAKFDLTAQYKVYPNLKDLRKYSLAAISKSRTLEGNKKSKGYSIGTEFESLREYTTGDDYRKINWMATARAKKLIVNTYQPERNQHVIIMVDSSRVMNSEINLIKKLDFSINASFLLADVAIKKGDNAGLMVFDSEVRRFVKPGKGAGQLTLIAENLYNISENMVSADYRNALIYLNGIQKRRSLLCIFTELFTVDEALSLVAALRGTARQHVPLVITIKDMRIYDIINSGVQQSGDIYLKSAAIKLAAERDKIRQVFLHSGIACIDIPPDKLSIETVNKYLSMKSTLQM